MSTEDRLTTAWVNLPRPTVTPLASMNVGNVAAVGTVHAAVDREGRRHLLIPVEDEFRVGSDRLPLLGVRTGRYSLGATPASYMDIECREAPYAEQFLRFSIDVVDAVEASARPGATAMRVLEKWRRLFSSARAGLLTERQRLALFSELVFVQHLLQASPELDMGVWRGPLREPHDFRLPGHCVEIKAAGADSTSVTIHGLEQLDPPAGQDLTLCVAHVVQDPEGRPIASLIDQIRAQLTDSTAFEVLLATAGWSPGEPDTPYSDIAWWVMEVDDSTPRLTPDSFLTRRAPSGIGNVRYEIDLAALMPRADGRSLAHVAREVTA